MINDSDVACVTDAIRRGQIVDRKMLDLLGRLIPLLSEMAELNRDFSQVIDDIEDESESIQFKDAVAWAETAKNMYEWMKQRFEVTLSISDFVDELIKENLYPRWCYVMDFFPEKSWEINAFYQKIKELSDSLSRIDCLPKKTTSQGSSSGAQGEEDNQQGHTNEGEEEDNQQGHTNEGEEEDNQQGHTNDSDPQATPNTLLPKTERVKVENVEFEIIKSEEDLCHGTFDSVCVSFLRHEDIEGAQLNNSLLRSQSSARFVRPQMLVNKPNNIWLVVEKIDSTLDQFRRNDKWGICSSLRWIFTRDILNGFIKLERRGYTADLEPQNIAIVNGRAKFMRLSNSSVKSVGFQRQRLKQLFEFILGEAGNNVELTNFYTILEKLPTTSRLVALRDHSIFLTCQQRILVPVLGHVLLKFIITDWRRPYDSGYQLPYDSGYQLDQLDVQWLEKFKGDPVYKMIAEHPNASYPAFPSSEPMFARNATVHINDGKKRKTVEQADDDLSAVLPNMLIEYMSFLSEMNIDVWDRYNKKNGEHFFSLWHDTLKLCMPENGDNDVVTEYFIKICRYFLAVIANHQLHGNGNGKAVSDLLTSIEENIRKVELKFSENGMKYEKLVSIIEDVDKTYRSSIDFLKRFLMFVHLVLEKYVQDPDGNVSTIFQDAVTIFQDAVKKFKASCQFGEQQKVKKFKASCQFGEQQKELLKHVPTDKQFKSLLNNPKNVEGCGTSTTELLHKLIHCLSSILSPFLISKYRLKLPLRVIEDLECDEVAADEEIAYLGTTPE
ncbi:hypothetical protein FCV25MIE_02872 [Fagus crenata]